MTAVCRVRNHLLRTSRDHRQFTSTVRGSCTFQALPQTTLNSKLTAASSQCPWKGRPSTLWPRTQTLAAVLLSSKVGGRWLPCGCCWGTCPEKEPAAQENGTPPKETTKGPRPGPDHLPEEHSESATRSPWLSGQRRTQVLLVRLREGRLQQCDILLDASGPRAQKRRSQSRTVKFFSCKAMGVRKNDLYKKSKGIMWRSSVTLMNRRKNTNSSSST